MTQKLDGLIRYRKWELDEKRRNLAALQVMLNGFKARAAALEAEILAEQAHAAGAPEVAPAYGGYAVMAIERRQTLARSIADVKVKIADAEDEVREAFEEMKRFEIAAERRARLAKQAAARRQQNTLDELALTIYRRRSRG